MSRYGPYHISQPWLHYLIIGDKKVEGRKATPKWLELKKGDEIIFCDDENNKYLFDIIDIHTYPDILGYLKGETLENCLPGIKTYQEGIKIYKQWSTEEELNKCKFLAIVVTFITKL